MANRQNALLRNGQEQTTIRFMIRRADHERGGSGAAL